MAGHDGTHTASCHGSPSPIPPVGWRLARRCSSSTIYPIGGSSIGKSSSSQLSLPNGMGCASAPTIHFGSLVFGYSDANNLGLIGILNPDRSDREIFALIQQQEEPREGEDKLSLDFEGYSIGESSDDIEEVTTDRRIMMAGTRQADGELSPAHSSAQYVRPGATLSSLPDTRGHQQIAPRDLRTDFQAVADDAMQVKSLLETVKAAIARDSPMTNVLDRAIEIADGTGRRATAARACPLPDRSNQSNLHRNDSRLPAASYRSGRSRLFSTGTSRRSGDHARGSVTRDRVHDTRNTINARRGSHLHGNAS